MSSTVIFKQCSAVVIGMLLLLNAVPASGRGNSALGGAGRSHQSTHAQVTSSPRAAPTIAKPTTNPAAAPAPGQRYVALTGTDTGNCSSSAIACRTIIYTIAQSSAGDTINIGAGTYIESPTINKELILQGAGASSTFVDGRGQNRIFTIPASVTAQIIGLTIRNGQANEGAGISNAGTLIVSSTVISGNTAIAGGGGSPTGAGIFNMGTLTIRNSMISGNQAIGDSVVDSFGAGIHNDNNGTLTLIDSTVSGNQATGIGGGVGGGVGSSGILIVSNSTFSGNTASGLAGGISSTNATFSNSTITNNTSGFGGSGVDSVGGMIELKNTILAGNFDTNGNPDDCVGPATSQGHNLIGNNNGCISTGATGDQLGTFGNPIDPKLGPLQNNGGPTQTHAPLGGSPAIDAGSPATPGSGSGACEATDQIGTSRPQGPRCDIGAVEIASTAPLPIVSALIPSSAKAGGAGFTLTIQGANFTSGATVRWNGAARPTTFVSSTQLTGAISAGDIRLAGTANVSVANPAAGESSPLGFIITPVPAYMPLLIRTLPPHCDAYEPNDDRKINPGGPLASGALVRARLCADDAEDNYYLDVPAKTSLQIALSIPPTLSQHLAIGIYAQSSLAFPLPTQGCFKDTITGTQFAGACQLPGAGRYIVRLYTSDGVFDNLNEYVLQVSYA